MQDAFSPPYAAARHTVNVPSRCGRGTEEGKYSREIDGLVSALLLQKNHTPQKDVRDNIVEYSCKQEKLLTEKEKHRMMEIVRKHELESFRSEYQQSHSYVFYVCIDRNLRPVS
jgi:hypothetical protein